VGNVPNSFFKNLLNVGFDPITMERRGGQQARMPGTLWLVVFRFVTFQSAASRVDRCLYHRRNQTYAG
jgi:hypothetical protein